MARIDDRTTEFLRDVAALRQFLRGTRDSAHRQIAERRLTDARRELASHDGDHVRAAALIREAEFHAQFAAAM